MRIGLIDVDGHNFPNLCLMKLSAWHKSQGDTVEWYDGFSRYDCVYLSRVFDDTYTNDEERVIFADEVIRGGTGYDLKNTLSEEVEHQTPDYALYGITDTAYGFLTRGCPRGCSFCIVSEKEGRRSQKVSDIGAWWAGQKNIKLLDPNLLAAKEHIALIRQLADTGAWVDFTQGLDARLLTEENIAALNGVKVKMLHFAWDFIGETDAVLSGLRLYAEHGAVQDYRRRKVYVLTNYGTTMDENLHRIYTLKEIGYDPFVMVYDKPHAPIAVKQLQRWVNNKFIFRSCARFEDYIA